LNRIVDVVNLNADASCLDSELWLSQLEGGRNSILFQWLSLYVDLNKKISLGIPGASLADIAEFNPDSIELIRNNPQVFEIIVRPFAHDNALLRTRYGFESNLKYGLKTIESLFGRQSHFFLPPEFMCNSEQIYTLQQNGIQGIFIQPGRFNDEVQERIPDIPYEVRGVLGSKLNCIPFNSALTRSFLDGIHQYNADKWNAAVTDNPGDLMFSWRDGESAFLLPNTVKRESAWLKSESEHIERVFLSELEIEFLPNEQLEESSFKSYPIHSFAPWLREMRMIGFTNKVQKIEELLEVLEAQKVFHWLMIINSDILSSVEKSSPKIEILNKESNELEEIILWRSERGFEGEEYLSLLKELGSNVYQKSTQSSSAHLRKFNARIDFLSGLSN